MCQALNAATGWDFAFEEVIKVGRRAVNMMRIFNLKCGLTSNMEKPSPRYGSTPVDGPAQGVSTAPHWADMLRKYYTLMRWNPETGMPFLETLKELGLEKLRIDLK